ncbi:GDSL/SGNH-like acyl-esterase family found in Pmr5 and Cas1p-domain-containing protein [Sporodiniella umbellata]|nr:GDSL/SGNH-like acyl-esterase family found in Pmr5 and Cas1p-domain-containing protein [Sporodiniella umbellata]
MLKEGRWENTESYRWISFGQTKEYIGQELDGCLRNRQVIYVGDSIMREQYYAMVELFRPGRPEQQALHEDQKVYLEKQNVTIEIWWDPFLDTNRTLRLLEGKGDTRPALLILDTGVWYMKDLGRQYLHAWKQAIDRVLNGVERYSIAERVLVSPVEALEFPMLSPLRKKVMTSDKIRLMNNYLRERERTRHPSTSPWAVPFVWNQMTATSYNQTQDGLHFQSPVTRAQAQIAVNYLCPVHSRLDSIVCSQISPYTYFFFTFCIFSALALLILISYRRS